MMLDSIVLIPSIMLATRLGVAWAALGHATAVFEAALTYGTEIIQALLIGRDLTGISAFA